MWSGLTLGAAVLPPSPSPGAALGMAVGALVCSGAAVGVWTGDWVGVTGAGEEVTLLVTMGGSVTLTRPSVRVQPASSSAESSTAAAGRKILFIVFVPFLRVSALVCFFAVPS